jgi:hypothetical protein
VSDTEFRDEVRDVVKRHAADLDAEDLRDLAADLQTEADRWEGLGETL